jgi:RNA polymerase sigma-B factor
MPDLANRPTGARVPAPLQICAGGLRARLDRALFVRRAAGDLRAREELIERFLPLARSLARRYEHHGEPLEDLLQVASLGLVKAIDRYDPARGVAFSSYAVPTIAGELKRHFRDRTWAVRPPRELQERTLRVNHASVALSATLDRAPTTSELAASLDVSDEDVLDALQACGARDGLSLQAPARGDDQQAALQDTLGKSDDGYERVEDRVVLDGLLSAVPARTRRVLRLRFEQDLTQAQIGALLGVSQMQISRIICHAIAQLRHIAEQDQRIAEQRADIQPVWL